MSELDLGAIKARLAAIGHSGNREYDPSSYQTDWADETDMRFVNNAPEDIAALVAEVERLAEANRELGSYVPQRAELGSTSEFERINFRSAEREAITRPKPRD